MAKAKFNK